MSSGGNAGLSRGRGTSVDRGRGRGTRGGTYHYNNRNFSEEGTDTSHPNAAYNRPRIFDRSQVSTDWFLIWTRKLVISDNRFF